MKKSLRALFALVAMALLLVGMNPIRHLCALAAEAGERGQDPHACCRGEDQGLVQAPASEPAGPAADEGSPLCDGDCCASASQGTFAERLSPKLVEAGQVHLALPASNLQLRDPVGLHVRSHGPRGPPPRPPTAALYIRNRVLLI